MFVLVAIFKKRKECNWDGLLDGDFHLYENLADIDGPDFEDGPQLIGYVERSGLCPVCHDPKCDNWDSIG